jgi:PAS domain S-box-containing protein
MAEVPLTREEKQADAKVGVDLRMLLESPSKCAIVIVDATGTVTDWSEGSRALYGYTEEEIIGQPLSLVIPSSDGHNPSAYTALLQHARSNGPLIDWNTSRRRKDGSDFPAAVAISSLTAGDGHTRRYFEIGFPKTDLEGIQSSEIEKLYSAVMSGLRAHIALLDRTGNIVAVNEAWTRFARENNGTAELAIGIGINYLDVCRTSALDCDSAARCLEGLNATLSGTDEEFSLEYACHSPQAQRWFQLCATSWKAEGGALVVHHDITERVKAEIRLQESEEHYRAMIENEVDIVTILDENANVIFESPALKRILGYSPEELVGRSVFDFIHPADIARVKEAFAEVLPTREPSAPLEFRFRHAQAGYRVVESIARNLLSNPAVRGIIVNSRDITQRREAEVALRRRDAALKLSHEKLRALSARLLEAEDRERRRISRELHDDVNQEVAALAVDIGRLHTRMEDSYLSPFRAEVRTFHERLVSLSDAVRRLAYGLHPSVLDHLGLAVALRSYCSEFARRQDIEIDFEHRNVDSGISPHVASCIYRVAQEALWNVAKHSKAKKASVRVSATGRFVRLVVRDNGLGFHPERVGAGQSLGLTSMEERSRLLNGKFSVVSSPGLGTTLKLSIPREVPSK